MNEDVQKCYDQFFEHYPVGDVVYEAEEGERRLNGMREAVQTLLKLAIEQRSVELLRDARILQNEVSMIIQSSMAHYVNKMRNGGLVAAMPNSLDVNAGWKK